MSTTRRVVYTAWVLASVVVVALLIKRAESAEHTPAQLATCLVRAHAGNSADCGSGVCIASTDSQAIVLTNHHVIKDSPGNITIHMPLRQSLRGRLLTSDSRLDVAVILVTTQRRLPFVPLAPRVITGIRIVQRGYPHATMQQVEHWGIVQYRGWFRSQLAIVPVVNLSFPVEPGESGSPVFSGDEKSVMGIVWGSDHQNATFTPSDHIAHYLEKQCRGGRCPTWAIPSRPRQPVKPSQPRIVQPTAPRQPPLPSILEPVPKQPSIDYERIIAEVLRRMPRPENGKDGQAGRDATPVDNQELADVIAKLLPPIRAQWVRDNGSVVDQVDVHLGETLPLRLDAVLRQNARTQSE